MKVYNDKRIIQRETDLIIKIRAGILTWAEAIEIMDKFLKKLGY